jgi:hypothetical protein
MFDRLRLERLGEAEALRAPLADFLDSHAVNSRTDDDKTLLLATRRSVTLIGGGTPEA